MDKVFISYRRDDAAGYARAIYEELTERLPPDAVFMDVDAIEPGLPFDEVIRNAVGQCKVLLVLIGARWLAHGADGRSRLEDERDFVRLEIAAALARKIRVIPVLLDGTPMPKEAELPEALHGLVWRNAIEVSNTRFNSDVERLFQVLTKVLDGAVVSEAPDSQPPAPEPATVAGQREQPVAAPVAQAPAMPLETRDTKVSGASGSGLRYLAGVAALGVVAVVAWTMWPTETPPPVKQVEPDVRAALDFSKRPWGVVFGSDRGLDAARDELRRASRNGVEETGLYLRNGYYASVALRSDRAEADRILRIVRGFRSDAYVADMRTWCLRPQPREGYVVCGEAP